KRSDTLGSEIAALYASFQEKGREAATPLHQAALSSLYTLEKHLEEYRNTLCFKLMTYLSKKFPHQVQPPDREFAYKLCYFRDMRVFLDKQYKRLETKIQREYISKGIAQLKCPKVRNFTGNLSEKEEEQLHLELCEMDSAGNRGAVSC